MIKQKSGNKVRIYEDGDLVEVREYVDREKVSDASISELRTHLNNINDKPTRDAVANIVEVLTGENILEE